MLLAVKDAVRFCVHQSTGLEDVETVGSSVFHGARYRPRTFGIEELRRFITSVYAAGI